MMADTAIINAVPIDGREWRIRNYNNKENKRKVKGVFLVHTLMVLMDISESMT